MTREEADANLAAAIQAHAEAYDITPLGGAHMLNDYLVFAHWQPMEEDQSNSVYTTHFSRPNQARHISVGLAEVGCQLIHDYDPDDEL